MIKLKSLLIEAYKLDVIGKDIPISDGFILRRFETHFGDNIFKVFDKNNTIALSCYVNLSDYEGKPAQIPYVSNVQTWEGFRGNGLYRRILPILKTTFGHIRSDTKGRISGDAEKAWKAVGATKIERLSNPKLYGASQYYL